MRRFLTLLLLLAALPVPQSFATDGETLAAQDLRDYLLFDSGSTWNYENSITNLYEETYSSYESSVTTFDCTSGDDCFTLSETSETATSENSYNIEGNTATYSTYNGVDLSKPYIHLSLDDYSEMVADEDYAAFGFTNFDEGQTSDSCETELNTNYEYQDEIYDALQESCTFTTSVDGTRFRLLTETTYAKGLGLVESTSKTYYSSIEILDTSSLLTDSSLITEVSPFSDVKTSDSNYAAIDYLEHSGVFNGYEDGTFKPNNTVNRAELIKILVEGQGITPDESIYKDCFTDIGTEWFAKYVCYAKEQGWVEGYADGSFMAASPVNKVEALKMLLMSQDVELEIEYRYMYDDVAATDWFNFYVQTAQGLGILEERGSNFQPASEKDREGIAENLYRLTLNLKLDDTLSAMAETTCLLFDENFTCSELEDQVNEIMNAYGYEDSNAIDTYLAYIRDLDFFQDAEDTLSSKLENTCGTEISSAGSDVDSLAAAMLEE